MARATAPIRRSALFLVKRVASTGFGCVIEAPHFISNRQQVENGSAVYGIILRESPRSVPLIAACTEQINIESKSGTETRELMCPPRHLLFALHTPATVRSAQKICTFYCVYTEY
jgi:hypothetical protein